MLQFAFYIENKVDGDRIAVKRAGNEMAVYNIIPGESKQAFIERVQQAIEGDFQDYVTVSTNF